MLIFEIISSRTCTDALDKKYVVYTIAIRQDTENEKDPNPCYLERRYSQFSDLYQNLKKEFSALMNGVNFPKKVMLGNFDPLLISCRSTGFESLLEHIANNHLLREAGCTMDFFQMVELTQAKNYMDMRNFDAAFGLLELNFKLMNKLYLDRSRVVLLSLCRLVSCGVGLSGISVNGVTSHLQSPANLEEAQADLAEAQTRAANLAGPSERWASLALRRFDGVSDSELLSLYVPLIQACIYIWKTLGKDCKSLEGILDDMRRRGMRVDTGLNLYQTVQILEAQQYNT